MREGRCGSLQFFAIACAASSVVALSVLPLLCRLCCAWAVPAVDLTSLSLSFPVGCAGGRDREAFFVLIRHFLCRCGMGGISWLFVRSFSSLIDSLSIRLPIRYRLTFDPFSDSPIDSLSIHVVWLAFLSFSVSSAAGGCAVHGPGPAGAVLWFSCPKRGEQRE